MLAEDHAFHHEFKDMLHEMTDERNHLHAFASSLSTCLSESGKHTEAEAVLREALAVQHRVLEAIHPNAILTFNALQELVRRHMRSGQPPKPEAGVASMASQLPAGTRVLLQRLVAQSEHNGKRARVVSFNASSGRYAVHLDDARGLSLKPECVTRAGCAAAGCKSEDATSVCGRCKAVRYCSRECQRADWKVHKPACL
jgi:hypothetical protein